MSNPTVIIGSPVPVQSLPATSTVALDDYLILDGPTEGTRRILAGDLVFAPLLQAPEPVTSLPVQYQVKLMGLSVAELVMALVKKGLLRVDDLQHL